MQITVDEQGNSRDFITESNQGKQVFFLKDKQAALDVLHSIN